MLEFSDNGRIFLKTLFKGTENSIDETIKNRGAAVRFLPKGKSAISDSQPLFLIKPLPCAANRKVSPRFRTVKLSDSGDATYYVAPKSVGKTLVMKATFLRKAFPCKNLPGNGGADNHSASKPDEAYIILNNNCSI